MMTKIDIVSGFLGSGKTTLIKKLISSALKNGEKVAVIENEFGEISIDGGLLREYGVEISEIAGGCICCTLFGDFVKAILSLLEEYQPDRIIIEPTGIGKLSDVLLALKNAEEQCDFEKSVVTTVIDPLQFEFCNTMFGDFFRDQIIHAESVILSKIRLSSEEQLRDTLSELKAIHPSVRIIVEDWGDIRDDLLASLLEIVPCDEGDSCFDLNCGDSCLTADCHHRHQRELDSITVSLDSFLSKQDFEECILSLCAEKEDFLIVRSKGYFSDVKTHQYHFDYASGVLVVEELPYKIDKNQCIFIGAHLDSNKIKHHFVRFYSEK